MLLREMQLEISDDNIEIEWEFGSDSDELDDDAMD
jgi:hypothetical protein